MEKELEKVKGALEDFGKRVVEAVKKGKGEVDKVAETAQVKLEIGSLTRQKKDLYQELGELFYTNFRKGSKKGEADVAECVGHLTELDKKVAILNRELKAIKAGKTVSRSGRAPKDAEGEKAPAKKAAAKKRGRPAKAASAVKKAEPKRRGRPAKAAAANTGSAAPKRRGRPPKAAKTEAS